MLIKAGTYRFNDVLSAPSVDMLCEINCTTSFDVSAIEDGISYEVSVCADNILAVGVGTIPGAYFSNCLIFYADNLKQLSSDGSEFSLADCQISAYDFASGTWTFTARNESEAWGPDGFEILSGFGQTITIPTDSEVSSEFYEWFTANAVEVVEETPVASIQYNGATIVSLFPGQTATLKCGGMDMESDVVVEVAEQSGGSIEDISAAFFAENFPSDTWYDGEYTATFNDTSVTMRYKYRADRTDPKNIAFVGDVESASGEGVISITNLADFYILGAIIGAYRIQANTDNGFSEILYKNPVVPICFDMSEAYSAVTGVEVTLVYSAIQCGVKTYEGTTEVSAVETRVNYRLESNAFGLMEGVYPASLLYSFMLSLTWYHEIGYAFGSRGGVVYIDSTVTLTENGTYHFYKTNGCDGVSSVTVDIKMSAVVGTWQFNDVLDSSNVPTDAYGNPETEVVNFTLASNPSESFQGIHFGSASVVGEGCVAYGTESGAVWQYYSPDEGWGAEEYKTINFGDVPQVVTTDFYEWLTANATPKYSIVQTE